MRTPASSMDQEPSVRRAARSMCSRAIWSIRWRLDFFGDELEEIRSLLPGTGQTISSRASVEIFPVREFPITSRGIAQARSRLVPQSSTTPLYRDLLDALEQTEIFTPQALLPYVFEELDTVGNYLPDDALTVVVEPRSLVDDALHYRDELMKKTNASLLLADEALLRPTSARFREESARNLCIDHAGGRGAR